MATLLDNSAYLRMRVCKLNQYQRTVLLIVDEIYVAKRTEYTSGAIQGLRADGSVASTLLCFMVKSLTGKYKDIVAIFPTSKLTATKLHDCNIEVMALLRAVSFNVVAISVDNAATNRKFVVDCLCGGTLKTHVIDPVTYLIQFTTSRTCITTFSHAVSSENIGWCSWQYCNQLCRDACLLTMLKNCQ